MRVLKGLLKILGVLVAIVLGAESYCRFVLKDRPAPFENTLADSFSKLMEFDPVTGTRYRINVDEAIESPTRDFTILYKTNEIHLRDRAMGTHLRQELKFLIFGDEFAEGWGNDIDRIFAVQAQNIVNEKTALKPPVRLVIAAESGYGAAQNYLAAKKLFETVPPKAVIFFYSSLMPHADHLFLQNAEIVDGLATGLKGGDQTLRLPHQEDHPVVQPGFLTRMAETSAVAHRLAEALAAYAATTGTRIGDPATDRLAGMRAASGDQAAVHEPSLRHVAALAALAKSRDVPFLLIHMPLPPQVATSEWAGGRRFFKISDGLTPSDDAATVAAFCAKSGLKCISLHGPLREAATGSRDAPLFYRTELALSHDGATWVGIWLADEILRWLVDLGYRS